MRNSLNRLALGLVVMGGLAALWIVPSHAQVPGTMAQPGMSPARVWINNRTPEEAIPVMLTGGDLKSPVPVTVQGIATVNGKVETTTMRQGWEYRESPTAIATLSSLGNDGWEVVGILPSGSALLKRPK